MRHARFGAVHAGNTVFAFGAFLLFPSRRLLLKGDRRIHLGGRAFDLLTLLVEHAGEVVGKDDLIAHAWPKVFVEHTNLKTQLCGLRRALEDNQDGVEFIKTVAGRGYSFVAPVNFFMLSTNEPASLHDLNQQDRAAA